MTGPGEGAKPDELALWEALLEGEWPRDAGRRLGVPQGRVDYICEKWANRRIYEYGVACDLGWPDPQPPGWLDKHAQLRATPTFPEH